MTGLFARCARALVVMALVGFAIVEALAVLHSPTLADFGSFWAAGHAFRTGLDPYDTYPDTFVPVVGGVAYPSPDLDPPAALLVFGALSLLPAGPAFRLWQAFSGLLYLALVIGLARAVPDLRRPLPLAALVALPALWVTLLDGQVEIPVALGIAGAWSAIERDHHGIAGVLIGLSVAVKPNLGVWPLAFLLAGYVAPALVAGAVALGVNALPGLLAGPGIYRGWVEAALAYRAPPGFNGSLFAVGDLVGNAAADRLIGAPLAGVAILALCVWCRRSRPAPLVLSERAILVALLASPICWSIYVLFLVVPFCARPWRPAKSAIAAMAFLPIPALTALVSYGALLLVARSDRDSSLLRAQ